MSLHAFFEKSSKSHLLVPNNVVISDDGENEDNSTDVHEHYSFRQNTSG